ncbi:MAG: efflux RND transporter periplasmic adaptor subunit [Desulfobulbaceae bacterium]|nr:MAG: efflux RND transporter periplasmic adaptor subunit [Desulfobulbaceae bacterium]
MKLLKAVLLIVALVAALGGGYLLGIRSPAGHDHGSPQLGSGTRQEAEEQKQQYTCGMHPFVIQDEPGLCPICGMALTPLKPGAGGSQQQAAAVTKWRSPMDPGYVRDAPGKDYMGHDLVPVTDGSGSGGGEITIDPVTAQNMGVRTEPVVRRKLVKTIRTVGMLTYEEGRQFSVNSKIDGWIEKLHVNQEGQMVKKGQPLMEIYSPELVAAQQEFLLALENSRRQLSNPVTEVVQSSERLLEAARTRLKYWDISPGQINAIERSGQITKTMTLYSPHTGVVSMKKALQGMRIMAGEELLQVSDISTIWVNADIFEYELPWVKVGQTARVELPFAAGRVFEGKITYIYPYLKNETRTAGARIELVNPGLELKPDMYATVNIDAGAVDEALAVPVNAVLNSGKGQTVFVARGDGRYEPRQVKTGVVDDSGYVQIVSGLSEGESVVVSAQFMLDSESTLREAVQKMMAPAGAGEKAGAAPEQGGPAAAPGAKDKAGDLEDLFK